MYARHRLTYLGRDTVDFQNLVKRARSNKHNRFSLRMRDRVSPAGENQYYNNFTQTRDSIFHNMDHVQ